MPEYKLTIKASRQPAILEQLLRVMRFRGFHVTDISMNSLASDQELNIDVCVISDRAISTLQNQLTKLVDVKQVFVDNTEAMHA